MDWAALFSIAEPRSRARADELAELQRTLFAPLSVPELDHARKQAGHNPYPVTDPLHAQFNPYDPTRWQLPAVTVPQSLIEFLSFSNGGDFANGERWFQMFPALDPGHGLRAMMLGYQFPEFMPMALPFAFNGGGTFYAFDLRSEAVGGEHRIVASHSGSLGWNPGDHWFVADSLLDAFRGTSRVEDLRPRDDVREALDRDGLQLLDVYIVRAPTTGVRGLLRIKEELRFKGTNAELLALSRNPTARVMQGVTLYAATACHVRLAEERDCLQFTEANEPDRPVSTREFHERLKNQYGSSLWF